MSNSKTAKILLYLALTSQIIWASGDATSDTKNSSKTHKSHWTYSGTEGPSNWGTLNEKYESCKKGKRQSPINIDAQSTILSQSINDIYVSYGDVKLNIVNNGHTVQVNSDGTSKALLGGKNFKLLQVHFHSLSEHTINGEYAPMEAHLVHQGEDGELAVIGVMIKEGKHNSFMQKVFKFMPKHANKTSKSKHTFNVNNILPKDRSFYHYMGSLTTPPCTQIVQWYILKNPISISKKQLAKFNSLYKGNNRPIQKIENRKILSN